MFAPAWAASPLTYIPALLLAGLIPEWPLRNRTQIGVIYLTFTRVYVPVSAGWRRVVVRNCLNNSRRCCEAGFNLAASCCRVAEERCHPAPQHTVCRAGAAYYSPPRCFANSIVS